MERVTRDAQEPEKPSRLQLAILEWQRQLLAKRTAGVENEGQAEAA
jgi:hypothetical protein